VSGHIPVKKEISGIGERTILALNDCVILTPITEVIAHVCMQVSADADQSWPDARSQKIPPNPQAAVARACRNNCRAPPASDRSVRPSYASYRRLDCDKSWACLCHGRVAPHTQNLFHRRLEIVLEREFRIPTGQGVIERLERQIGVQGAILFHVANRAIIGIEDAIADLETRIRIVSREDGEAP